MNTINLWPNLQEILNPSEDSPNSILECQSSFLNEMSNSIKSFIIYEDDFTPEVPIICCDNNSSEYKRIAKDVICRFVIKEKRGVYRKELLRIKYNLEKNYPLSLYNCINQKTYNINTRGEFDDCLKTIFSSSKVKEFIRNIITQNDFKRIEDEHIKALSSQAEKPQSK